MAKGMKTACLSLGRPRLAARLANSCMAFRMFSAVESSVEASSSSAATTNVILHIFSHIIHQAFYNLHDSWILLYIYTGEEILNENAYLTII